MVKCLYVVRPFSSAFDKDNVVRYSSTSGCLSSSTQHDNTIGRLGADDGGTKQTGAVSSPVVQYHNHRDQEVSFALA